MRPTVVSLFSGCGGLDLGFAETGFALTYACDHDAAAIDCYTRNVDKAAYVRDVTGDEFRSDLANLGRADVVLGGFPCQGFSKAGPKRAADERNILYRQMLSAISVLRPRVFVAENVDGMAQNFSGLFLKQILSDFGGLGYRTEYRILNALSFGVPQHRRRVFFAGTLIGTPPFEWPRPSHIGASRNGEFRIEGDEPLLQIGAGLLPPVSIKDAISDLLELDESIPDHAVSKSWPASHDLIMRHIGPGQKLCNVRHAESSVYTWDIPEVFGAVNDRERLVLKTIAANRRHKRYGNIPNGNPLPLDEIERLTTLTAARAEVDSLLRKGYLKEVFEGRFDLKGAMFCSGMFKRPDWDAPSPTVLTNFHNPRYFFHPRAPRPFSLRECARLQGFPDSFGISGPRVSVLSGYRLVGNAVPPPVSRRFAMATLDHLRRTTQVTAAAS